MQETVKLTGEVCTMEGSRNSWEERVSETAFLLKGASFPRRTYKMPTQESMDGCVKD